MKYIVAARHTERERKFDEFEGMEMKEIETRSGGKLKVVMKEIEGDNYVLCKSDERQGKDRGIRAIQGEDRRSFGEIRKGY